MNDRMQELHRELERFAREAGKAGKALANLGAHLAAMFPAHQETGRWQPGDVAADKTGYVWLRSEKGWRSYAVKDTGQVYCSDTELESAGGPLIKLPGVPEGTDRFGMIPCEAWRKIEEAGRE